MHPFPPRRYSFDVLRSDSGYASLMHIASSSSLRPRPECAPLSSEDDDGSGKKHVCRTCHKRFNRPSSLRIHANTHTGATPFRCPFPGCRREFNVNSNMRRHYRNHAGPESDVAPPTCYLVRKRRPAVNRSEYVWCPASSGTPSDEEELSALTFGEQGYRETSEETSEEKEYVRRQISDVRTTT
ncbi:hypothetical protein F5146DRAFT_1069971 [Armillaria mellea]|nr:hypothetical protein F5146DRAFT_1069971 [Armillaria mellea]